MSVKESIGKPFGSFRIPKHTRPQSASFNYGSVPVSSSQRFPQPPNFPASRSFHRKKV
jgi:hypothetical protein